MCIMPCSCAFNKLLLAAAALHLLADIPAFTLVSYSGVAALGLSRLLGSGGGFSNLIPQASSSLIGGGGGGTLTNFIPQASSSVIGSGVSTLSGLSGGVPNYGGSVQVAAAPVQQTVTTGVNSGLSGVGGLLGGGQSLISRLFGGFGNKGTNAVGGVTNQVIRQGGSLLSQGGNLVSSIGGQGLNVLGGLSSGSAGNLGNTLLSQGGNLVSSIGGQGLNVIGGLSSGSTGNIVSTIGRGSLVGGGNGHGGNVVATANYNGRGFGPSSLIGAYRIPGPPRGSASFGVSGGQGYARGPACCGGAVGPAFGGAGYRGPAFSGPGVSGPAFSGVGYRGPAFSGAGVSGPGVVGRPASSYGVQLGPEFQPINGGNYGGNSFRADHEYYHVPEPVQQQVITTTTTQQQRGKGGKFGIFANLFNKG